MWRADFQAPRTDARTPFVTAVQGPGCVDNFCRRQPINNRTRERRNKFSERVIITPSLRGKKDDMGKVGDTATMWPKADATHF